jgi:hypothetical protein
MSGGDLFRRLASFGPQPLSPSGSDETLRSLLGLGQVGHAWRPWRLAVRAAAYHGVGNACTRRYARRVDFNTGGNVAVIVVVIVVVVVVVVIVVLTEDRCCEATKSQRAKAASLSRNVQTSCIPTYEAE